MKAIALKHQEKSDFVSKTEAQISQPEAVLRARFQTVAATRQTDDSMRAHLQREPC